MGKKEMKPMEEEGSAVKQNPSHINPSEIDKHHTCTCCSVPWTLTSVDLHCNLQALD